MKLSKKLISRCEPITKTQEDGSVVVLGYRRKSYSKKAGQVYTLTIPKVIPKITPEMVKEALEIAKAKVEAEAATGAETSEKL